MKNEQVKVFLAKMLSLVAMVLGYASLMGILNALIAPAYALRALWHLPLLLLVGMGHFLLKGRARAVYAVAAVPLYAVIGILIMPSAMPWYGFLPLLIGCFILVLTPKAAKAPLGSEWGVAMWATALFAGLFVQVLLRARGLAERVNVLTLRQILLYMYAAFICLLLFNLNRLSMDAGVSARGKSGISATMLRRNRGSVAAIFLIALLLSLLKTLGEWMVVLKEWLKAALRFILTLVKFYGIGAPPMEGDTALEPDMMGMMGIEEVEKSGLALFLEKLIWWVGILAGAAIAVVVLIVLFKKLRKLFAYLMSKLHDYMNRSAEDYEDETENIFDADEVKKLLSEKVRSVFASPKREKQPRWQQLDARGKVRYLYRMFYERHPKQQHLTAREALLSDSTIPRAVSEGFAACYEQARYSDHPIADQDAEKWKEKLKY